MVSNELTLRLYGQGKLGAFPEDQDPATGHPVLASSSHIYTIPGSRKHEDFSGPLGILDLQVSTNLSVTSTNLGPKCCTVELGISDLC